MNPYSTSRIAVLGTGPFGLLLSQIVADGHSGQKTPVHLWHADPREAEQLRVERASRIQGQSFRLRETVEVITDYTAFEQGAWIIHVAVSSRQLEDTMRRLIHHLDPEQPHLIVIFTKGLLARPTRRQTGLHTFSQYVAQLAETAGCKDLQVAAVNGPSLLAELLTGRYSYFNIGTTRPDVLEYLHANLSSEFVTLSDSRDVLGVELAGALKNPIAIVCGMAEILPGAGSNVQGVLLSRGYLELFQFATGLGAEPATLLGISGLADVVATSTSAASRNRSYGMQFMRRSLMHENDPGFFERIELYLHPRRFIEQEVLENQELVEGAFALTPILEIAEELGLDLPVYSTLYDILTRRKKPAALLQLIVRHEPPAPMETSDSPGKRTEPGNTAGHKFKQIIERRTVHSVLSSRGMQDRIHRQSENIIKNLSKRLSQAQSNGNSREQEELPRELSVWESICSSNADEIREHIEELIEFYVDEISDRFRPGIRGALIHTIGPIRTILGGLRSGSGIPHIGGEIETLRSLAPRYNILYAPTHRSHLDSIEVAFGLYGAGLPLPRYAAGSNLMTGPFWKWILKSLGAYAVDRERTRNILYLECLSRYATMMLEIGIPSLVYPEGTRSRTGGIAPLKTGLLSTAIDAYRNSGSEILVVPVAVSYENVPEDRQFAGVAEHTDWLTFLRGRTAVYVDVCEPIRVSRHIGAEEPALEMGNDITAAWAKQLRILPNHILARALIQVSPIQERNHTTHDLKSPSPGITHSQLETRVVQYLDANRSKNLANRNPESIIQEGLKMLKKRRLIEEKRDLIVIVEPETLRYYSGMAG